MNYKEVADKIKAMSAKEIIMAMVEGLENPACEIDMSTYAESDRDGVCFGCAATNTIARICGVVKIQAHEIYEYYPSFYEYLEEDRNFVSHFENAIDALRLGIIAAYNNRAYNYGFAPIEESNLELPFLTTGFTASQLEQYRKLANLQI